MEVGEDNMANKTRETGKGSVIFGTNGDDTLSGLGGSYILKGRNGNDTYIVDGDDTIDEKNNGGTDHVISYADWTLGENLENPGGHRGSVGHGE